MAGTARQTCQFGALPVGPCARKALCLLTDDSLAAAVLLSEDERWQGDAAPCPGAEKEFLRRTEEMALRMGKRYLRLDSTRDNEALTAYYERCGFQPAGECALGTYEGTLRQKPLAS